MKKAYGKFFFTWILLAALLTGCGERNKEGNREGNGKENRTETESEASQIVFECQDMDGNTVSASIFSESKLIMINVWATYCNPCLSEMPGLGELAGEYETEEFRIIGIISDVPEGADAAMIDNAAKLIELTGADYTHLLLNKSVYDALLTDVTAVPTTFFVNENGEVVDTVIGAMEKTAWEEKINALLEDS